MPVSGVSVVGLPLLLDFHCVSVLPLWQPEYLTRYTLGFTRTVAHSLYMNQGLRESKHLIGLADCDSVDKLCKYVCIEAKTTIALQASQRLSMLVYYLRH
jgi:hypothetical protein